MTIPTRATSYRRPARTIDAALVREGIAVLLILAGVIGLIGAAFMTDVRLGIAAMSTAILIAGALLGLDR